MIKKSHISPGNIAVFIIFCAVIIRLLALGMFPLQDTSEARYGEMVRLMVETNNWITPYFDYDVPFWGKPPLFIWMAAISMKLFGINEFAARLPGLICGLGVMWLCWRLAIFQLGRMQALLCTLILTSTAMFLVLSGTILADPVNLFSTTLILASFWIGWHSTDHAESRQWQYLFFVGCGIALLAKGPVSIVIPALPIFFWCLPKGRLITLSKTFPWITGTLLTLLIAAPWYITAEIKTPGFLNYFIIGEHFSRYVESGWDGDQYGNAHIRPLGTIWHRWIIAGLPWSAVIVFIVIKAGWRRAKGRQSDFSTWEAFLWLWLLMPLVFFTFSKNMIWTYALPVAPAPALILASRWKNFWPKAPKRILATSAFVPLLLLATSIVFSMDLLGKPSHKPLIIAAKKQSSPDTGEIIYWQQRPFSARYYSEGKALLVKDVNQLRETLANNRRDFLATTENSFDRLPEDIRQRFTELKRYRNWILWQENTKL